MVELMIVIAIVGVLAAIALPVMANYQLRAKRAEAPLNIDGLFTAIAAYAAENDGATLAINAAHPVRAVWDKQKVPWSPAPASWDPLAWEPDGDVYCNYWPRYTGATGTGTASAFCNSDADNTEFRMERRVVLKSSQVQLDWSYCKETTGSSWCTIGGSTQDPDAGCDCY